MTISLCLIIKNEEKVLRQCLNSFKDIADEIIIVDTGSVDNSKNIAKEFTDKIYDYKWDDDFSKARNYAISKATCDYFLWVDADDYILETEKEKIKKLKKRKNNDIDMYYFLYDFNENYEPFYRERLIKNNNKYLFKGKIHEAIIPSGNIKYKKIIINQFDKKIGLTNRNLNIYLSMDENNFSERDYYYFAKELLRHSQYEKAIKYFIKFLSLESGYYIDKIDACYCLSSIFKLQKKYKESLQVLFFSFNFDLPKVNILCEIAEIYYLFNKIDFAIYYYKLALKCKNFNNSFINKDYIFYIPNINLSLCYLKLKNYKKARYYSLKANKYKKGTLTFYEIDKILKDETK